MQYLKHLQVLHTEDHTYSVDVTAELEALGLALPDEWEATPYHLPVDDELPDSLAPWLDIPHEIYVDLPIED
jgi:hypothetical protein